MKKYPTCPLLLLSLVWTIGGCSLLASHRPDYDSPDAPWRSRPTGVPPRSEAWQVTGISDGDTLNVRSGSKQDTIRLCGIDAPELDQPLGNQAKDLLRSLIDRGSNQVLLMPLGRDRDDRQIGEVFIKAPTPQQPEQELFINAELVKAGLAWHYGRFSGDCPNRDAIVQAETEAKRKQRGIWGRAGSMPPWEWRQQ